MSSFRRRSISPSLLSAPRSQVVGVDAYVVDDDDLEVLIGRALEDARHAMLDQDERLVADLAQGSRGWDDDAHLRLLGQTRIEPIDTRVLGVAGGDGGDAGPIAVGLDRPRPCFEGPRLRVFAAASGRGRERAPVIEHPRHVDDATGALGDPQDEVPVLGAFELGVEAADFVDQRSPHRAQMAGVHLRPHPLRRPVGLEERTLMVARLVDLVFVGVDVVDVGRTVDRRCDQLERFRVEGIVVVEQRDELAGRHRQGVVGSRDDAAVRLARGDPYAWVPRRRRGEHLTDVRARRGVVDEAKLPVAEGLALDRSKHRREHGGRGLVDRRENREAGGCHH
jgi:hypothetical protein